MSIPHDLRVTWLRRLLTCTTAAALIGVSAAAIKLANDARTPNIFWHEGSFIMVRNGSTLLDHSEAARIQYLNEWWGKAYYLPPGVKYGGFTAIRAAGGICIAFAGLSIIAALLGSGVERTRLLSNLWRAGLTIPLVASLVAFVYNFVERYTASTPDVAEFLAAGPRRVPNATLEAAETVFTTQGTYDVESWSCAIKPILELISQPGSKDESTKWNPCEHAMTARWLTLPMFIVAVVLWLLVMAYSPWKGTDGGSKYAEKSLPADTVDERGASVQTEKSSNID